VLDLDGEGARRDALLGDPEKLLRRMAELDPSEVPEDIGDLKNQLADQHICNFSVFQSLLDHWALGALFPIVPVHRLHEAPKVESTLVDITCDSDGKVSKFIDIKDVRDTLTLHAEARRALLPRDLPHGRVPGHHGRHPQPVRPRERGPRVPR
jgi:arginine decarboxylase